jgi:hypothetical protein
MVEPYYRQNSRQSSLMGSPQKVAWAAVNYLKKEENK